ncbi:MAG: putative Serine/threonine-protein kinase Nek4 [Streblomastix strix]|uniref:non-specific serine/threonine protein kinase n=1 Tax=Streblomastix strix TaxID=222440 RepID=A0A5J4WPY0_9EUKA|nr:MAG: putative Serine/threonine-protein kinase Nek4 [Streblomastix strix]
MGLSDYQVLKQIGKGSFGKVYLVLHKAKKRHFVLKSIPLNDAKEAATAKKEAEMLRRFDCPFIVKYFESFSERGMLFIIMEYCDDGDLNGYFQICKTNKQLIPEERIIDWFTQILIGLDVLHKAKVLHRDIKAQNIFLTKKNFVKLGDFGIARNLSSSRDMAHTLVGTPYYMSPELSQNKPYNHKSDVWALGCLLYEMTTFQHPFEAANYNQLVVKIAKGQYKPVPPQYSKSLGQLVDYKRPTTAEVLDLPIIRQRMQSLLNESIGRKPQSELPPLIHLVPKQPVSSLEAPPPEESNLEALKVALPQSAFNSAFVDSGAAQKALPPPAKGFVLPSPQFPTNKESSDKKDSIERVPTPGSTAAINQDLKTPAPTKDSQKKLTPLAPIPVLPSKGGAQPDKANPSSRRSQSPNPNITNASNASGHSSRPSSPRLKSPSTKQVGNKDRPSSSHRNQIAPSRNQAASPSQQVTSGSTKDSTKDNNKDHKAIIVQKKAEKQKSIQRTEEMLANLRNDIDRIDGPPKASDRSSKSNLPPISQSPAPNMGQGSSSQKPNTTAASTKTNSSITSPSKSPTPTSKPSQSSDKKKEPVKSGTKIKQASSTPSRPQTKDTSKEKEKTKEKEQEQDKQKQKEAEDRKKKNLEMFEKMAGQRDVVLDKHNPRAKQYQVLTGGKQAQAPQGAAPDVVKQWEKEHQAKQQQQAKDKDKEEQDKKAAWVDDKDVVKDEQKDPNKLNPLRSLDLVVEPQMEKIAVATIRLNKMKVELMQLEREEEEEEKKEEGEKQYEDALSVYVKMLKQPKSDVGGPVEPSTSAQSGAEGGFPVQNPSDEESHGKLVVRARRMRDELEQELGGKNFEALFEYVTKHPQQPDDKDKKKTEDEILKIVGDKKKVELAEKVRKLIVIEDSILPV